MAKEFYVVSDLHFGGDGALQQCDYTDEFVAFLRDLAAKGGDIELVIAGDTFGFWELTTVEGVAKFDVIVADHRAIFDQLRETGKKIKITVMVGNHDYDLACDPAFKMKLAEYNLDLDTSISVKRELLGRTIWIEHGQQQTRSTHRRTMATPSPCRWAISSRARCQWREPFLGLWTGKLAEGHSFRRHPQHSGLDPVELFLSGDGVGHPHCFHDLSLVACRDRAGALWRAFEQAGIIDFNFLLANP